MDSSGSVSVGLPPPPPPPPPMLNMNAPNNNGRSQLLADIRKGATLKKTPLHDSNQNVRNKFWNSKRDKAREREQEIFEWKKVPNRKSNTESLQNREYFDK